MNIFDQSQIRLRRRKRGAFICLCLALSMLLVPTLAALPGHCADDKPVTDKEAAEKPVSEKPAGNKPLVEKSFKGWELYSWRDGPAEKKESWHFSL